MVFNHIPQISLYTQESRISYVLLTIITLEHRYTMLERQPAGRFVPETVQNVGSQIMAGVSFMHEKGVVHRDLKIENIMIDADGMIRIVDFGVSKQLDGRDDRCHTITGTPQYVI